MARTKEIAVVDASDLYPLELDAAYVTAPVPKRMDIPVPSGDGVINTMQGLPNVYEDRTLTMVYHIINAVAWKNSISSFYELLHSYNHQIITPDNRDFYWSGDLHLISMGCKTGDSVVLEAQVSPWRRSRKEKVFIPSADQRTLRVSNHGLAAAVPVISTSEPLVTLSHGDISVDIHQGSAPVPELIIPGKSFIMLSFDNPDFKISFSEGIL